MQAFGIQRNKKANINVKNEVYKKRL